MGNNVTANEAIWQKWAGVEGPLSKAQLEDLALLLEEPTEGGANAVGTLAIRDLLDGSMLLAALDAFAAVPEVPGAAWAVSQLQARSRLKALDDGAAGRPDDTDLFLTKGVSWAAGEYVKHLDEDVRRRFLEEMDERKAFTRSQRASLRAHRESD